MAEAVSRGVAPVIDDPNGVVDACTRRRLAALPALTAPMRVRLPPARVDQLAAERSCQRGRACANLRRLHDAGVAVAMGTDAGNPATLHGVAVFREMEAMQDGAHVRAKDCACGCRGFPVHHSAANAIDQRIPLLSPTFDSSPPRLHVAPIQLSPVEVMRTATLGGAAAMGREGMLGTLAAGAAADMVLLRANPLTDVRACRQVEWTMRGGRVWHVAAIRAAQQKNGADCPDGLQAAPSKPG